MFVGAKTCNLASLQTNTLEFFVAHPLHTFLGPEKMAYNRVCLGDCQVKFALGVPQVQNVHDFTT